MRNALLALAVVSGILLVAAPAAAVEVPEVCEVDDDAGLCATGERAVDAVGRVADDGLTNALDTVGCQDPLAGVARSLLPCVSGSDVVRDCGDRVCEPPRRLLGFCPIQRA